MQPQLEIRGVALNLTEAIFLMVAGFWLLAIVTDQIKLRLETIFFMFALLAGGLLASASLSPDPRTSYFKFAGEIYLIALALIYGTDRRQRTRSKAGDLCMVVGNVDHGGCRLPDRSLLLPGSG